MVEMETYKVPLQNMPIRLSDFVPEIFISIPSKKGMKKAINKGLVFINNKRGYSGDYIKGGETIILYRDSVQDKRPIISLDLPVLYEDDYLAVINKPAGIVVSGNKKWTIANALSSCLQKSTVVDALVRPTPIHRLDMPTTGVLLIGKTAKAVRILSKDFENKKISKKYICVAIGKMKESGQLHFEVENKASSSIYKLLQTVDSPRFNFLNLVELSPLTGRKHQLRIHMAKNNTPILGDPIYGKEELILKGKGLYLHAKSLLFKHPITNTEIKVVAETPKKYLKIFPQTN